MNQSALISVLLPLYNEPVSFASKAIDSILDQTYKNIEVILILDNPCNNELHDLIKTYESKDKRIKIAINEKNIGLPNTLNSGIEKASGDYIARMDGDDISDINRFLKQLEFLKSHPDVDLLGTDSYAMNENGDIIGEYRKLKTDFAQKTMLKYANINLIHPTWLGKSNVFKKCKYRNFTHCEDYDFMARAYAFGYKFANLNEKLFYCRIQQKSCASVSRKFAYEQYVNTLKVRQQLNDFLNKKLQNYPDVPTLVYDSKDREKYQNIIPLLNQLRESFMKKDLGKSLKLFFSIMKKDYRPLTSRIRVLGLSKLLLLGEKLSLIH